MFEVPFFNCTCGWSGKELEYNGYSQVIPLIPALPRGMGLCPKCHRVFKGCLHASLYKALLLNKNRKTIYVRDLVGITNPKSVAHFGEVKKARVIAIKDFDGSLEIGGHAEYKENGDFEPAYILLFQDGSNYSGPYRRREITLLNEEEDV